MSWIIVLFLFFGRLVLDKLFKFFKLGFFFVGYGGDGVNLVVFYKGFLVLS